MQNYGEIVIYQMEDGHTKINVNMKDETVWLSLEQMAQLFQRDKSTISRHIKMFLRTRNLTESQRLQNLQQFKMKESVRLKEQLIITIWMLLFPVAIVLNLRGVLRLEYGQLAYSRSTLCGCE